MCVHVIGRSAASASACTEAYNHVQEKGQLCWEVVYIINNAVTDPEARCSLACYKSTKRGVHVIHGSCQLVYSCIHT